MQADSEFSQSLPGIAPWYRNIALGKVVRVLMLLVSGWLLKRGWITDANEWVAVNADTVTGAIATLIAVVWTSFDLSKRKSEAVIATQYPAWVQYGHVHRPADWTDVQDAILAQKAARKARPGNYAGPGGKLLLAFALLLPLLVIAGPVACLKKREGESPSELKARKLAATTAQGFKLLNAWSDSAEVLKNGQVLSATSARKNTEFNERMRGVLDQVGQLLRSPKPVDAIAYLETAIAEVEKAEANGLFKVKNAQGQEKYVNGIALFKFTLRSLRSVLAVTKEPSVPINEAKSLMATQSTSVQWLLELISIGEQTATDLYILSRADTPDAWAAADMTNALLRSKNESRLSQ